jgi:hypothetical protein
MLAHTRYRGADRPALFAAGYEAVEPYGRLKCPDLHAHLREFNLCRSAEAPYCFSAIDRQALARFLVGPACEFERELVKEMRELGYEVEDDPALGPTIRGLPPSIAAKFSCPEIALMVCVESEARERSKDFPHLCDFIRQILMDELAQKLKRCHWAKPAKEYVPLAKMRRIWLDVLDHDEYQALTKVVRCARGGSASSADFSPTPPWEIEGERVEETEEERDRPKRSPVDPPEEDHPTADEQAWLKLFTAELKRLQKAIAWNDNLVEERRRLRRLWKYVEISDEQLELLESLMDRDQLKLPLAPAPAKDRGPSMG